MDFSERLRAGLTQPAHSQRSATSRANFNRHLVVGTTNTTRLHFNHRLDIAHGRTENFERILASLGGDDFESAVHDAFGNRLLTALHDGINELGNFNATELRIRQDVTLWYFTTTGAY